MLVIRKEQVNALEQDVEGSFVRQLTRYLREKHPSATVNLSGGATSLERLTEQQLLSLVAAGIKRGRSHGLTWASSLTAFVVLMFLVAPNFDEHPAVSALLEANRNAPDVKCRRLWEDIPEAEWQNAKHLYNAAAWK